MTEKELRKLNRRELLELLLYQTKRADALQEKLDNIQNASDGKIIPSESNEIYSILKKIQDDNIEFLNVQKEMLVKTLDACYEIASGKSKTSSKKNKNSPKTD